ncbi:hypothetical protein X744_12850 [Mesorhizobium sp. LNJC372A00]|nr:hypothetical protein X745_04205 [Mesorhizobium sp. LNJC374B00]ESY59440.1 hypothetical protein X744_12850 [Mesorhizobium sp. LNJC372A00]
MSNVIAIEPFDAAYPVKQMGGKTNWYQCQVIGVVHDGSHDQGRFVIITEGDDGQMYTSSMPSVRRVDE